MCTLYDHGGLCCGYDCYEEAELDAFEDDEDGWLDAMDDLDDAWWLWERFWWEEYRDYAEWWR